MPDRREFIVGSAALGALAATSSLAQGKQLLSMNYAPHHGHFKHSAGEDIVSQISFAADQGFLAWEDNRMRRRSVDGQKRIADVMQRRNLLMGVFVAADIDWERPTLASGDDASRQKFLDQIRGSVEIAKRVNAQWMTVVPGTVDGKIQLDFQIANVVETLKRACDILEPHGLTIVLEPLNFVDHPHMLLTEIPQTHLVCKAVDSPACKILFDIYHQQITEGNIISNITDAWDEIAYFQVGDVPGRNEPTTGEINYSNVFRHIRNLGFEGIIGMEHGQSGSGAGGERRMIHAYRTVDRESLN